VFDDGTNVGVGEANPTRARLQVAGNTASYSVIGADDNVRDGMAHYDTTAMGIGVGGQLVLGYKYCGSTYTEGAIIKMYKENATDCNYSSGLKFQVRTTGNNLSTKMILTPSGNVGIGTTIPGARLESYGSGLGVYLNQATAGDIYIRYHVPGIRWWTIGPKANGDFWLSNASDHSGSAPFVIKSAGNVGIGTTAPVSKLDVNGKINVGRKGIAGAYNSTQVQGIWSIDNQYEISTANNDFGGQYGIVYAHTNAGTSGTKKPIAGWGHQILLVNNGTRNISLSMSYGHAYFAGEITMGTKTRYYAVSPSSCAGGSEDTSNNEMNVEGTQRSSSGALDLYCPVNLPDDAIVTKVQCWANHSGTTWWMRRVNTSGAGVIMASGGADQYDTTISYSTINNESYAYLIRVWVGGTGQQFDMCSIDYTITKPYP